MRLSEVIAIWDILHEKDTGDIGYCDLEKAIEQVCGIENDIPSQLEVLTDEETTIAKNSNEIRSAIREQVQALLQRKLSIWDSNTNWQKLIDEETDKIMKVIKHR